MNISHVQLSPGGRERVKKNGIDEIQALERKKLPTKKPVIEGRGEGEGGGVEASGAPSPRQFWQEGAPSYRPQITITVFTLNMLASYFPYYTCL